jgi:hypothetical protein
MTIYMAVVSSLVATTSRIAEISLNAEISGKHDMTEKQDSPVVYFGISCNEVQFRCVQSMRISMHPAQSDLGMVQRFEHGNSGNSESSP